MCMIFFFFLCIVLSSVNSAVIQIDQVEIPGHPGECYDKDAKIFYKEGEILKNEGTECAQRKCLGILEETGQLRIEVFTCPAVEAGPGCTIIQDPTKPYPECCPQIVSMPSVQQTFCQQQKKEEK